MAQTVEGITKGDVLQRIAGISFIVGAVLWVVHFALPPRIKDPTDMTEFIEAVRDNMGGLWEVNQLLGAIAVWALLVGVAGVHTSIPSGAAGAWARLAAYGVIVGTTLYTFHKAIEIGYANVVEEWVQATGADTDALLLIAIGLRQQELAVPALWVIIYWSALALLGIAMTLSTTYPKWLGWSIIVIGAVTVAAVGIPGVVAGTSATIITIWIILTLLTIIWALATGIWMTRRAW